jgi:hypothetical protein
LKISSKPRMSPVRGALVRCTLFVLGSVGMALATLSYTSY